MRYSGNNAITPFRATRPAALRLAWMIAYLAVGGYRLVLCAQPPEETSDLFRNLGYASHLVDRGVAVYHTLAADFAPEFWATFWSSLSYVYPPAALLFFAPFGASGLGLFYVKAALTLADLATAVLTWHLVGPLAGFLVFSAPAAVWYGSHEGQYEGLVSVALAVTVWCCLRQQWARAGMAWCVALQLKHFALLLGPFVVAALLARAVAPRARALRRFVAGWAGGMLPFLPFYVASPGLWLRPLHLQHGAHYNPLHWNVFAPIHFDWQPPWLVGWNALATYTIVACLGLYLVRQRSVIRVLQGVPAFSFWVLVKTLQWGQFWYVIPAPALTLPLRCRRGLVVLLLALYWGQCGRSVAFLMVPAAKIRPGLVFGRDDYRVEADFTHLHRCLWSCDYQAHADGGTR
jgi:hypothetical protein